MITVFDNHSINGNIDNVDDSNIYDNSINDNKSGNCMVIIVMTE